MEEHENLNNQDEVNEEKIHENIEETKEENSSEEVKKEPVKEEIKQEEKTEYKKVKHVEKNNPKKVKAIIISLIIVLAVMIFSIIFALLNMSNDKILKGITILGIDVSNLTIEEATTKVNNAIDERFKEENSSLILKREDNETNVTANTFNAKFDTDSAINEAYNIGRKGNIITNNYEILITIYKYKFLTNSITFSTSISKLSPSAIDAISSLSSKHFLRISIITFSF